MMAGKDLTELKLFIRAFYGVFFCLYSYQPFTKNFSLPDFSTEIMHLT